MSDDRAQLLARIKKCLALAKSANENEAAAALAKARVLMDEYGVDQADVELLDVDEKLVKGGGAWTPSRWESLLARAVTMAIPCERIVRGESGWAFIGLTPAPEIAAYAFTALFRQLRRARRDYIDIELRRVKSARRKTARADAFCEGWSAAVLTKVKALYPEQEAGELVLAYMARRYPSLANLTPRAAKASGAAAERDRDNGWAAGKQVDLNKGVGGSAPTLALK